MASNLLAKWQYQDLLTSGYTGDVLEWLRSESEFPIIGKPFQLAELVQRLRSILDDT